MGHGGATWVEIHFRHLGRPLFRTRVDLRYLPMSRARTLRLASQDSNASSKPWLPIM